MQTSLSILHVDDDIHLLEITRDEVSKLGHAVESVTSGEEALSLIQSAFFDVLLLDIQLPGISGIEVLKQVRDVSPHTDVVIATTHADNGYLKDTINNGSVGYLLKPLSISAIKTELSGISAGRITTPQLPPRSDAFFGEHEKVQNVIEEAGNIARAYFVPVLLTGEAGVGKEILAKHIHELSRLRSKPFVYVDCRRVDEYGKYLFGSSNETEEFREGVIESAINGTLFLDNINLLPTKVQADLLRFIETFEYYPWGASSPRRAVVRILSSVRNNLVGEILNELRSRLRITLRVPSLHERLSDTVILAERFLSDFNDQFSKRITRLGPTALEQLIRHDWPGNVRELRSCIESSVLHADDECNELAELDLRPDFLDSIKSFDELVVLQHNYSEPNEIAQELPKAKPTIHSGTEQEGNPQDELHILHKRFPLTKLFPDDEHWVYSKDVAANLGKEARSLTDARKSGTLIVQDPNTRDEYREHHRFCVYRRRANSQDTYHWPTMMQAWEELKRTKLFGRPAQEEEAGGKSPWKKLRDSWGIFVKRFGPQPGV